jgi:hypothetical protein
MVSIATSSESSARASSARTASVGSMARGAREGSDQAAVATGRRMMVAAREAGKSGPAVAAAPRLSQRRITPLRASRLSASAEAVWGSGCSLSPRRDPRYPERATPPRTARRSVPAKRLQYRRLESSPHAARPMLRPGVEVARRAPGSDAAQVPALARRMRLSTGAPSARRARGPSARRRSGRRARAAVRAFAGTLTLSRRRLP